MGTKLYVGNISYQTTDADLQDLFAPFGTVTEIDVIMDKFTNRPRGFAFVTMSSEEEAKRAVEGTNGKDFDGRSLTVNEARAKEDRPARSGGGGGFGGGGGHRGGGHRKFDGERRGGYRDRY
ncbi:MAG: RNA-binding protein [Verrucomicrobiales bacterium]|jgi:RNA recognition motif-containing protein|nr:RNA-binding protein [Verrucomicrobiales bacterium]